MIRRMPCAERKRLLEIYAEATHKLSLLTHELADLATSYERDAFDRGWEHCEEARKVCSDIRALLYAHVAEHRCALSVPLRANSAAD